MFSTTTKLAAVSSRPEKASFFCRVVFFATVVAAATLLPVHGFITGGVVETTWTEKASSCAVSRTEGTVGVIRFGYMGNRRRNCGRDPFFLQPFNATLCFAEHDEEEGEVEHDNRFKLLQSPSKLFSAFAPYYPILRLPRGGGSSDGSGADGDGSDPAGIKFLHKSAASDKTKRMVLKTNNQPEPKLGKERDQNPQPHTARQARNQKRYMSMALFFTYFAVMGAKCALPSTMSQLVSPLPSGLALHVSSDRSRQDVMARVLTISTISIALGKFCLGPIIDTLGGILSLKLGLTSLAILLSTIAFTNHFRVFAVAWVLVDFLFASFWPSCINAIHQVFPKQEWGECIARIATAARLGNASAFALFSAILHWAAETDGRKFQWLMGVGQKQSWRLIFLASSLAQLIPLTLLLFFFPSDQRKGWLLSSDKHDIRTSQERRQKRGKKTKTTTGVSWFEQNGEKTTSPLQILRKEMSQLPFWLHMISRSCLMVYISFLLFVPTYVSQSHHLSLHMSAKVGSIFALGCLTSVTLLSGKYSTLFTKKQRIRCVALLLSLSSLCAMSQLCHVLGLLSFGGRTFLTSTLSVMTVMFLWGFSSAVPFYVPSSLFALRRGGEDSSATIADALDLSAFGFLALFNGYVAKMMDQRSTTLKSWRNPFAILVGCACTALMSQCMAIAVEDDEDKIEKEEI